MVHDRASSFYVPVFYALTTARTSDTYWDVFNLIIQATDQQLEPAEVVCDFEAGLIGAVQVQFPNTDVIACLFHFKQAVRRRMRRLVISEPATRFAMERGMLDMLAVMPPDSVSTTGIAWVKVQIKARCRTLGIPYVQASWRSFWAYFRRTWVDRFPPDVWNVHGMSNRIVARTNNPLERFNSELNASFATPHPNMATFVTTIEDLSQRYVATLEAVKGRHVRRRPVETIILPTPPDLAAVDVKSSSSDCEVEDDEPDARSSADEESDDSSDDGDVSETAQDHVSASDDRESESLIEPDLSFDYEAAL
jgi:hypothetical protein